MPLWPFGRKKQRNSYVAPADPEKSAATELDSPLPQTATPQLSPDSNPDKPLRRRTSSHRKRRRSSEKLNGEENDGDHSGLDVEKRGLHRSRGSREDITALPGSRRMERSPHLRRANMHSPAIPYSPSPTHGSRTAMTESNTPSPAQSRRGRQPSQKSSAPQSRRLSKRQEIQTKALREEEIRAMSAPSPVPRRDPGHGDLQRRDTKKARRAFSKRDGDSRGSHVSLPFQDSIHSSMSGNSDQRGWQVSGIGMLSARPTVRLSGSMTSPQRYELSRDGSKKGKMPALTEESPKKKDRRRIAELADDLDATDIRAVMERDMRRRDKKRTAEYDKLERSLKKRAEKQRREEERRAREPPMPPTDIHPAFRDQGSVNAAGEPDSSMGQAPPSPTSLYAEDLQAGDKDNAQDGAGHSQDPFKDSAQDPFDDNAREPSLAPIDTNSTMRTPIETPMEDPVVATAEEITLSQARLSQGSLTPPASPMHQKRPDNLSPLRRELTPDLMEKPVIPPQEHHRASDPATKKPGTWAQFFRRGGPSSPRDVEEAPARKPETSFSNTSRESMSRQPIPAHLIGTGPTRRSNTPVRTQSIFREDLPESPLSPPDSRVQSPDIVLAAAHSASARRNRNGGSSSSQPVPGRFTPDSAGTHRADSAADHEKDGRNSAMAMSTSLASIGSEAEWLTGRPSLRKSGQSQVRGSAGSSPRPQGDWTGSFEDLGMPEEEYFQRLAAPGPKTAVPTNNTVAQSKEADDGLVRRDTNRRKPTLVYRDPHVRSREGLLAEFQTAEVDEGASRPGTAAGSDDGIGDLGTAPVQTVEYGQGHARQLSSGSARLLHISRKDSRSGRSTPDPRQSQVDTSTNAKSIPASRL